MQFVIVDSEGAVLDTFGDRKAAESALRLMVNHDWACSDDLLLLAYSDAGDPAGDAIMFEDINPKVSLAMQGIDVRVETYPLATATHGYFLQKLGGYFALQPQLSASISGANSSVGQSTIGQLPLPS